MDELYNAIELIMKECESHNQCEDCPLCLWKPDEYEDKGDCLFDYLRPDEWQLYPDLFNKLKVGETHGTEKP